MRQTAAQFEGAVQRRKVEGEPSESDRLKAGEADTAAVFATKRPQPVKQNFAFSNIQLPIPIIKQDFHSIYPRAPVWASLSTRLQGRQITPDHARIVAETGGSVGIWHFFPSLDAPYLTESDQSEDTAQHKAN
jgi:hypothetical protein